MEIVKLQRIIEEADAESTRQKNELSAVVSQSVLYVCMYVCMAVVSQSVVYVCMYDCG